jgi:NAD(P)-dependent dehydrogenase (short-subunit alcohol dehydrogenase family)
MSIAQVNQKEEYMYRFDDQVVMVTGAGGNLGSAVSKLFEAAGAHLVLVDRKMEILRESLPDLVDSQSHYLDDVDVTNPEAVGKWVDETRRRFGRIDVLVNTVGTYRADGKPHETGLDTWDFLMMLNARTALVLARAVIPTMQEQEHGRIINISARAGLSGSANASAYSASKSALSRLTESLGEAYKHQGITANAVMPSTMDTPANREAMPDADFNRWVKPEDVAKVIAFLASIDAKIISGALIPAYGRG